jgi:Bacterial Alpha-2-macroglobulin MG10 domain/Alpha-2-macroglobulin family/MG2 domain
MIFKSMVVCAWLVLSVFGLAAQTRTGDYDAKWKTVDSLITKAYLAESALAAIDRIYTMAHREHNDAQEIKALIYRMEVGSEKQEDADTAAIRTLEAAISQAVEPSRSILQSLLAQLYRDYLQQNRWKWYGRTATVNVVKSDIGTWTIDDLHQKIGALYLASLKHEKILLQTRLADYDPILLKGNARYLRPTLYDVLGHEALDYFKQAGSDVNQPADVFELDDPAVFADAAAFAGHVFHGVDTASPQYNALLLLQKLIGIHLTDAKPDALIDNDIYRIGFAHGCAVMDNKDELYLQALVRLTTLYGDQPAVAEAWYLEAQYYAGGPGYSGGGPGYLGGGPGYSGEGKGDLGEGKDKGQAKAICDRVLAQKDSSMGQSGCRLLLKSIVQKELALKVEKVNLPGQPFRSLVTWRNFGRLNLRLVRIDSIRQAKPLRVVAEQDYWKQLLHMPVARSFSQDLPDTGDYSFHSTEIPIGALQPGMYALMGCSDDRWDSLSVINAAEFYISGIAFINQGRDYFVVDRGTGHPLSGAGVRVWKQVYSSASRSWEMIRTAFAQADGEGHFQVEKLKEGEYGERLLEFTIPGRRPVDPPADRLFMLDEGVPYFPFDDGGEGGEAERVHGFLFLDRAIYRPGQIVYFKGIVVAQDSGAGQPKVVVGRQAKLILYNSNNERVDSLEVTTNEFGSYHGSFRLPEHQLNGYFRIADEEGDYGQNFSVEEYKRPGFAVTLDQPKGSYRVGDSIRVRCSALAYAGNALDGARIKYRVFRQTEYSFSPRFRQSPWLRGGRGQEIGHGEGTTDGHGVFEVVFAALPDRRIHRSADPRFDYTIEMDVTDINGETRSGSVRVAAGYTVLNLSIDLPEDSRLAADSFRLIAVSATNLAGQAMNSRVHLAAYPLVGPGRLVRKRLWQAPDRFVLTEAAFLDSFPHDEYREETNKENWARGPLAREVTDSTNGPIAIGRLSPGWWVIEATTTDAYGQPVKDQRYVELYDGKTGRPASPEYDWAADGGSTVEPGGKASTEIGSSAEDVYVIRKQEKAGTTFAHFTLNNDKKMTEWAVTEADRGGFGISDVFIKDNRMFTHRYNVTVPWTNKELQIRYTTFRDKTEPGSAEKWAVSIGGHKGSQVTAEVLTAMYDASLDQFKPQSWSAPLLYTQRPEIDGWGGIGEFREVSGRQRYLYPAERPGYAVVYDRLLPVGQDSRILINGKTFYNGTMLEGRVAGVEVHRSAVLFAQTMVRIRGTAASNADATQYKSDVQAEEEVEAAPGGERPPPVQIRKNFNETAFFFPDLRTDSAGNVSFFFTMPEAVTRWKWMTLAHTRDLAFGYSEKSVVTQKQLMVQPNVPRFLREGDKMNLSVKVVNMTDSEMTGQMGLQLTDPTTGETADGWFVNRQPNQYFTVAARSSEVVDFPLDIPFQYNRPLTYRIVAQAGNYSDGEEATLPVVSNRMLVTETLPLNMTGDGTRSFHFDKLRLSGSDETLNHHALTVEFTANPAWYAVQALPYLMEYPYECAEQTFNRFYSNALASKIANSSPRLAQVFAAWRMTDTAALLSNLQKNSELKSVLLEETPWVLQGKTEAEQRKNIALLFDLTRMSVELNATIDRLREMQAADGGFVWFKGGPDNRYITQYILTGIGHLQRLQALPAGLAGKIKDMVTAALAYTDARIREDYERDRKVGGNGGPGSGGPRIGGTGIGGQGIGELAVQYLYMRSFFNDYWIPGDAFASVAYYRKKAQQGWVGTSKYLQGMIALALFRTGDVQTARNIIASLRQSAIRDPEKGMYWKSMEGGGYYWYQAPVEMQSLLIEAFREIGGDAVADREMKTWLLRQKQTHSWPTTKATADACYALLMGGEDWIGAERAIDIRLGDKTIEWPGGGGGASAAGGQGAEGGGAEGGGEAGTGYYKKIFDGPFVNPSMGNITVTMKTPAGGGASGSPVGGSPAWGAVYWQYFDQLDHITSAGGSKVALRLAKRLFVRRDTDRGPVLDTIPDSGTLKVGDKVVVRIELRADRDLEYVHMKDMRAACLEPVDVLSGYRWQGGLGYYETTKDASTDFFFATVPRGTYVFEYTLVAGQTGDFSNGIASVECMYAPEFAFHSEGIRINVEGAP